MAANGKKYDFTGKVALITGSSSGIGAAIALQLSQYGCHVTITGRDSKALNNVAEQIERETGHKPLQIVGDLLDQSFPDKLIDETIKKYGQLDFLVNNAGGGTPYRFLADEKFMEGFDNVFALNVRSVVQLSRLAVPYLEKTKGNIVNISSIASTTPYSIAYSSAKAALDMVTKTIAQELGPKGIRVNSINPGPVKTNFLRSVGMTEEKIATISETMAKSTLLNFIPESIEIANLASFLLSEDARNMTGSIIVSDTGASIRPKW